MQSSKLRNANTASTLGGMGGDDSVQSLRGKINLLEKDLERRQESYVVRERAYKTRIEELESEIEGHRYTKTGWMKDNEQMKKLKAAQTLIIENVELVQDRTAKVLQEQERDLLRAFRARLFDVQTELEKEKSKKEDGASAWMERSRQLEAELEWTKEVADRLERVNQTLLQENNRLKSQFKSQEEDREFLIKQLVTVKKDNAKLRGEYVALEEVVVFSESSHTFFRVNGLYLFIVKGEWQAAPGRQRQAGRHRHRGPSHRASKALVDGPKGP